MKYFILILLALQLTNCTVQKRLYRSGYHVEWNNSFQKKSVNHRGSITNETDELIKESRVDQPVFVADSVQHITDSPIQETKSTAMEKKVNEPFVAKQRVDAVKRQSKNLVALKNDCKSAHQQSKYVSSGSVHREQVSEQTTSKDAVLGFLISLLGFCCGLVLAAPDLAIGLLSSNSQLPFMEIFKEKRDDDSNSFLRAFARGACIGIYTMIALIVVAAVAIFLANIYAQAGAAGILTILLVVLLIFLFVWWLATLVGDWFYDMGHRG